MCVCVCVSLVFHCLFDLCSLYVHLFLLVCRFFTAFFLEAYSEYCSR